MNSNFNATAYIKELIEQRNYLLSFAEKTSALLSPRDDTRKNFNAWCEEHRIPEFKTDDEFDDLVYQIHREAQQAYRVEDVVITMKDRFDGFKESDFDADTIGDILVRFEKALSNSDSYYEAYWNALDEVLDDACIDRCEDCEFCGDGDLFVCTKNGIGVLDLLKCPIGKTLRRTAAIIEENKKEEN